MPAEPMTAVRDATVRDAEALARLAGQLGYACDAAAVRSRLAKYRGARDERVIVVEAGDEVAGWTSAALVDHFYIEAYVEISGFVVDESRRGQGLGRALMAEVERWAREHDQRLVRLRANVVRAGAHRFYERLGFERKKEQYVFEKLL
jgi:GNAT superfamily N-acetyltransferase